MSATIGDNGGPTMEITLAADVEEVNQYLSTDTAALRDRAKDLTAMMRGFLANHPRITSEEVQGQAADVAGQTKLHLKLIEGRREIVKRPWIEGGKAIQEHFKSISEPVAALLAKIEGAQTVYAREIEARRKRQAQAEAARLQREADAAAALAAESLSQQTLEAAEIAAAQADNAIAFAAAKPAEHSRVTGDYGTVSSLRQNLVIGLTDISSVPVEYLLLDERRVRADVLAAKRRKEALEIPGVKISWESQIANYTRS